jgi:hypothetical protein
VINGLRILAALIMGFVGWYYVVNARNVCRSFSDSAARFKPPFSYMFRLYGSKGCVFTMRLGGCIALLISAVLFGLLIFDWER